MQGVWVFASAAARDAAVTSPQEGNFAYLKDTNVTTYYTGSAWANLDTTGMTNPMTTTGDTIYSSSGSTPARLGIGSTGQVLTVAGGVPSWATPAAGGFVGCSVYRTSDQSVSTGTYTAISWQAEHFDSDSFWTVSPNPTRLTIPSGKGGKYQVNVSVQFAGVGTGDSVLRLNKNGNDLKVLYLKGPNGDLYIAYSQIFDLSAADYLEAFVNPGTNSTVYSGSDRTNFSISYLGA
jgi:hypothetical protein